MVGFILGINENVVNENHDELLKLRHKYQIHKIHEVGGSIRGTKETKYSYSPYRVEKVVLGISSGRIFI